MKTVTLIVVANISELGPTDEQLAELRKTAADGGEAHTKALAELPTPADIEESTVGRFGAAVGASRDLLEAFKGAGLDVRQASITAPPKAGTHGPTMTVDLLAPIPKPEPGPALEPADPAKTSEGTAPTEPAPAPAKTSEGTAPTEPAPA